GVKLNDGNVIMPDPVLIGRNKEKLQKIGEESGVKKISTDLNEVLTDKQYQVYFDAQSTGRRVDAVKIAIAAGKHIYCEKPVASSTTEALELYRLASKNGLKNGVVQDKLWLPGMVKLKRLIDSGTLGRIYSVKGDFGYWVFEGFSVPSQRPSWNYRKEDNGGIILDMFSHWRYVLDNIFGKVLSVSCIGATHIPKRIDEGGKEYKCTADDAAYGTFELENGIIAQFNSSWCTRVRRDDLLTIQVDGTKGSAVAGLRDCYVQDYGSTPRPVWNPDIPQPIRFLDGWEKLPAETEYPNAFKAQWELFIKHVGADEPFPWTLLEGARGVQLAELALKSWNEKRWINVPELK
ncbi:MAG TPA: Gfo/Idh/MocA family oxidoreductase, partial [Cyclobacteriaceae bacterium]|nr:Gfo/Idh/MocA family oxidoreductase [Cyclobacteriaceae bacterium]